MADPLRQIHGDIAAKDGHPGNLGVPNPTKQQHRVTDGVICRSWVAIPGKRKAGVDGKIGIDEAATTARTKATSLLTTADAWCVGEQWACSQLRPNDKGTTSFRAQSCIVAME